MLPNVLTSFLAMLKSWLGRSTLTFTCDKHSNMPSHQGWFLILSVKKITHINHIILYQLVSDELCKRVSLALILPDEYVHQPHCLKQLVPRSGSDANKHEGHETTKNPEKPPQPLGILARDMHIHSPHPRNQMTRHEDSSQKSNLT